jgi:hypothetical protein
MRDDETTTFPSDLVLQEINLAIGACQGAMDEVSRQINEISRVLHVHIENESGNIQALSDQSRDRHDLLNKRLDTLERTVTAHSVRWGVAVTFGSAVIGLSGWAITLAVTTYHGHIAAVVAGWLHSL